MTITRLRELKEAKQFALDMVKMNGCVLNEQQINAELAEFMLAEISIITISSREPRQDLLRLIRDVKKITNGIQFAKHNARPLP